MGIMTILKKTYPRKEVTPPSTGWEIGEQVWRRVENLSRKSPKMFSLCLPLTMRKRHLST